MGIIVAHEFMTLDGVVQAPGGPDEDQENGFTHGGWQAPYTGDDTGEVVVAWYESMSALLLGRKTYDIFAGYWPLVPAGNPFADRFNTSPKYVVSRGLEHADWAGTTILRDATPAEIAPLKERHAELHVVGSSALMQTLLAHNLVDRLDILLYPVLLGSGKRLFRDGIAPAAMTLVNSRIFPGGPIALTYERAGRPAYGTMSEIDE